MVTHSSTAMLAAAALVLSLQAIAEAGLLPTSARCLAAAHRYVEQSQVGRCAVRNGHTYAPTPTHGSNPATHPPVAAASNSQRLPPFATARSLPPRARPNARPLTHLPSGPQVVEEAQAPLATYYRHISKGAWPFSTRDHGWPISDCSSEGLKAALTLAALPAGKVRGSHR